MKYKIGWYWSDFMSDMYYWDGELWYGFYGDSAVFDKTVCSILPSVITVSMIYLEGL